MKNPPRPEPPLSSKPPRKHWTHTWTGFLMILFGGALLVYAFALLKWFT